MPRRSHGEAVNRRRILAIARRMAVLNVDAPIIEKSQAERRLMEIDQTLSPDDQTLSIMNSEEREQTLTGLRIERVWLLLRLGIITKEDKQRSLTGIFDELEKTKIGVFNWLVARNEYGLSMAERIRNKVVPPIRIGGYHTKR